MHWSGQEGRWGRQGRGPGQGWEALGPAAAPTSAGKPRTVSRGGPVIKVTRSGPGACTENRGRLLGTEVPSRQEPRLRRAPKMRR
jgi:hypothetical protein